MNNAYKFIPLFKELYNEIEKTTYTQISGKLNNQIHLFITETQREMANMRWSLAL